MGREYTACVFVGIEDDEELRAMRRRPYEYTRWDCPNGHPSRTGREGLHCMHCGKKFVAVNRIDHEVMDIYDWLGQRSAADVLDVFWTGEHDGDDNPVQYLGISVASVDVKACECEPFPSVALQQAILDCSEALHKTGISGRIIQVMLLSGGV